MAAPQQGGYSATKGEGGYGPLYPTTPVNMAEVSQLLPAGFGFVSGVQGSYLALPEGFSCTVFGMVGTPMADGKLTPPAHDGMAAFDVDGKVRLVRNHEVRSSTPATGPNPYTEDRGTAGFYRFLPNVPGNLAAGGKLQVLAIKARSQYDTRTGQRVGKPLPVTWVDIATPDPVSPDAYKAGDGLAVYKQGYDQGGATFARLEGAWYGDGKIFINSTSGGDAGLGQVWQYEARGNSGGQLTLIFESTDPLILDAPDNICVSPRSGLVLCEDGNGDQYVRGLTQRGQIFDVAQNLVYGIGQGGAFTEANEFAGATFSPDGQTLFFNVQTPGLTFAIWGPWEDGAL